MHLPLLYFFKIESMYNLLPRDSLQGGFIDNRFLRTYIILCKNA